MTDLRIRLAETDRDVEGVGELIACSFDDLAANRYLVPDPARREQIMGRYFTMFTRYAAAGAGQVQIAADGAAAAVWFDRTITPPPFDEYEEQLAELAGDFLPRFAELDEVFDKDHPQDPHWHLAFLAVHPDHQRAGLGSRLLTHTHDRLDAHGIPAYLEATNEDNVRLYHRHGYADLDPFAIDLEQYGPRTPFFRMWRAPTPA
jgi:ribosomal protein S18 acetylase RimI-like enzyme